MIQSASDIQKRSDEKRGIKPKTYKLPLATIARIEMLASQGACRKGLLSRQLLIFMNVRLINNNVIAMLLAAA